MNTRKILLSLFWFASIVTVFVMTKCGPSAWDFDVYWRAARALHQHMDPYAIGVEAQRAFHENLAAASTTKPPMTYVYPPMTLPMLRCLGELPENVAKAIFDGLLVGGFLLQLWAGWKMATVSERRWLQWLLPAVAFFPGLLNDDVLLSGNVAYLLYGLILAAAIPGWKRNRWTAYFCAVIFASCFKAPMLSMLALPLILGRNQKWRTAIAGAVGSLLFAGQLFLWPTLFHEYLTAVKMQFDYNSDFGISPSGQLGNLLFRLDREYVFPTFALYLVVIAVVSLSLWVAAREMRERNTAPESFVPIALLGTLLLNPRIKEYDLAAVTIPLLLSAVRLVAAMVRTLADQQSKNIDRHSVVADNRNPHGALVAMLFFGWFLAANIAASGDTWKPISLALMLIVFGFGCWRANRVASMSQDRAHECALPRRNATEHAIQADAS